MQFLRQLESWGVSWFAGYIAGMFKDDYTKIFMVPLVLTVACAVIFMALFRPKARTA